MAREAHVCCRAMFKAPCHGPIVKVFGRWYCKYVHAPRCGWSVGRGRGLVTSCHLLPVAIGPNWAGDKRVPVCRVHSPEARLARDQKRHERYRQYLARVTAPEKRAEALERQVRRLRQALALAADELRAGVRRGGPFSQALKLADKLLAKDRREVKR